MTTPPPPPPGSEQQPSQYGSVWQDPPSGPAYGNPPGQQGWGPGHPPAPPVPPQPAAPQRSWFRRHKILTALLAVLAFAVVANLAGDEDPATPVTDGTSGIVATPPSDSTPGSESAASGDEAAADPGADAAEEQTAAQHTAPEQEAVEEPVPEQEPVEEPAPEPETPNPGLGEAVRDGSLEFTVLEVETGLTTIGEGFTEETPQGQFVLIDLTVTNIGDRGTTLLDSNQILIDEQGRQHNTSSAGMWLDDGLWLDEINPGNSMTGVLVYDIPTDAVPTSLELHDSMFSGGVTVSLP